MHPTGSSPPGPLRSVPRWTSPQPGPDWAASAGKIQSASVISWWQSSLDQFLKFCCNSNCLRHLKSPSVHVPLWPRHPEVTPASHLLTVIEGGNCDLFWTNRSSKVDGCRSLNYILHTRGTAFRVHILHDYIMCYTHSITYRYMFLRSHITCMCADLHAHMYTYKLQLTLALPSGPEEGKNRAEIGALFSDGEARVAASGDWGRGTFHDLRGCNVPLSGSSQGWDCDEQWWPFWRIFACLLN